MIAGIDRYRSTWVVAAENDDGTTTLLLEPTLPAFVSRDGLEHVVVDVPIGLPERGVRDADAEARERLGERGGSVLGAPLRPTLPARTWKEMSELQYAIEGKKATQQAYGMLPAIREVDELITPELQELVREGHPEVSFAEMAGEPMTASKHKPEGRETRLELLRAEFDDLEDAMKRFNRPLAEADVVDAYALLWTARRLRDGDAATLPDDPPTDARGLRMEIVV